MYLTVDEYIDITGEPTTEEMLTKASRLLDARIGNYYRRYDGWKLNIDVLPSYPKETVKQWVAQMATHLTENPGGSTRKEDSISLGRFSVDYADSGSNSKIPDEMQLIDAQLVDAGLIHRSVQTRC